MVCQLRFQPKFLSADCALGIPSRRRGWSDEDWHSPPVLYQPMHISVLGDIGVRSTVRTAQADIGPDLKTHEAHALA